MIPPRKIQHEEGNVDSWLMSYADMITLLLCFFIIFVSVADIKQDKLAAMTKGMADKFGLVDLSTPFKGTFTALQGVVEKNKMFKDVAVESSATGVEMEIAASKFFQPNSAELAEETLPVLSEIAQALKKADFVAFRVAVEAHTDNTPAVSGLYASNWEFSSARAARMVRFLIENGIKPSQVKAVGFGDSQPKVPNEGVDGKPILENKLRNQRIVIKLERVQ